MTKTNPESFRDFAAEERIGDDNVRIYCCSRSASSSKCGQDCHAVTLYLIAEELEVKLGEVLDSETDANAKIAAMAKAAITQGNEP